MKCVAGFEEGNCLQFVIQINLCKTFVITKYAKWYDFDYFKFKWNGLRLVYLYNDPV